MIKTKKSLGQNFLIDKNILEKIVNTTTIKNKIILEIGPGTGNLTSYILKKKPKKFFVVEKDNELAFNLKNNFKNQLIVINDDILKLDETNLFKDKVTVFGNLPYNISTEILSKWIINLKDKFWFDCLVLKKVSDTFADDLAFMISQKIQDEMQYPGQVKVTVIREKRATAIAR